MFGLDNWPQIANTIETKTQDECEAHYYSFYYKSSQDRIPAEKDIIIKKSGNGSILIDRKKADMGKDKEEVYLRTKPQIFNDLLPLAVCGTLEEPY